MPLRTAPSPPVRIAFVGTCLPRQCGIATYTAHLAEALASRFRRVQPVMVAVTDVESGYEYSENVAFEIDENDRSTCRRAAEFLNFSGIDLVCVQHEFGIYGGNAGAHVVDLIRDLRMPIVTTLHTVMESPDMHQRMALNELVALSDRLVTISAQGARLLETVYDASPQRIDLIPHGIPDMPFVDTSYFKDQFGVQGQQVMMTFGLLSPNKGIEHVIRAMPKIVNAHPDVVYIVLGATHPVVRRRHGEAYRESLEALARELGVAARLKFVNEFVSNEELNAYLGAADIYLTPYLGLGQVSSGTLAFAVGAGKAVVSTPYWFAKELLADERGMFTDTGDPDAIAEAVTFLLEHPVERDAMRKRAYLHARQMTWSNVSRMYMRTFQRAKRQRAEHPRPIVMTPDRDEPVLEMPALNLSHLRTMTDSTGLLQHANGHIPNYHHGYCLDDNARALHLMALLQEDAAIVAQCRVLSARYMSFVNYAFDRERGRFRNFLGYGPRIWLEEFGSDDCHGRTLAALGAVVRRWRRSDDAVWAATLFRDALPMVKKCCSPRTWAFALLGLNDYLAHFTGDRTAREMRLALARRLLESHRQHADANWPWFENRLTYANATLPEAMITTGWAIGDDELINVGLDALSWLADVQRADDGHFVPIGNRGFHHRTRRRARFDQQPIEAHAMTSACLTAWQCTRQEQWKDEAERAFQWFLGQNDLRVPLYDARTGGCRDGLLAGHVNLNQGAESTLAFLHTLVQMQLNAQVAGKNASVAADVDAA